MSSEQAAPPAAARGDEPNHLRRFLILWLIGSAIGIPIIIFLVGPLLGPSSGSTTTAGQHTIMVVLAVVATPVFMLVMLYLLYAIIFFRQPRGATLEGPAVHGNSTLQATWIVITTVIVLGLAAYGTYELEAGYGHGSGNGPNPVTVPSGPRLPVQVIGQQWLFTYRYPTLGNFETTELVLPVNKWIEFNVTSLDVIHSFWAYKLGVKADANPGVNNIAYVKPKKLMSFWVRCAELCGIWHANMTSRGRVVSPLEFVTWVHTEQHRLAAATKVLPKYSKTYIPKPQRRAEPE
jgi:cytochrome c oxidase subunit II